MKNDTPVSESEIRLHKGRPTVFVDGRPMALPTYSPRGWDTQGFHKPVARFFQHRMGAYFLCVPRLVGGGFWDNLFWNGDHIQSTPLGEQTLAMDEQAEFILKGDPDAYFIVRGGPHEPPSWRDLHLDQLVVSEMGEIIPCPSLASDLFVDAAARVSTALVEYCESRPWASRLIGYWNGLRFEGSHEPMFKHWLFDHSPVMKMAWQKHLLTKYGSIDALGDAWQAPGLTEQAIQIPRDLLLGNTRDVAQLPYWQPSSANQPMRDYLLFTRDLFHRQMRGIIAGTKAPLDRLGRKRFLIYDALKQSMLGWSNSGFFDMSTSWPGTYAELMAGSGHMDVAGLLGVDGLDGIITPHDYEARGIGGVYEPEGCVDSCVLRGKYFMSEMDTRTWHGHDHYGRAENHIEFDAVTWRNLATSLTRGFNSYWMDLHEDWFADADIHQTIARQVQVMKESVDVVHADVPGIAVVLDDSAVLETNGNGAIANETILWEWRSGLARCGVPYRIYLLQDLEKAAFPHHRVFYFPNLYRLDEARLELLRRTVFNGNRLVLWGPGSGISDGKTISPKHASRLTGFKFDIINLNYPRRVRITNYSHPLTQNLSADTLIGGPLSYGPCLFPSDGTRLGIALTKQGRSVSGLAVKDMGNWTSVFTTAAPLPSNLWRELARFAGAHIWCESDDVVLADESYVGLHSVKSERKVIQLPRKCRITDLRNGKSFGPISNRIEWMLEAPETALFRIE